MIGQTISHYRIEAQLGKAMGTVYRAHDERLERKVALKLLTGEAAGRGEQRARVLAEARAASALNHPGITTIYEVGEDGDRLFIVMELVTGKTLRAMVSEGPAEPRALARLGGQVAEALAAAHALGVVHGDVKPENIIVQPDGRLKLLDFGIARHVAEEAVTLTRSAAPARLPESQVAGTLAYMAPEQLRGEETDARADLFSLGILFYELAAGRRPFPGPTGTALAAQILNDPAPSLESGGLPAEMARIIRKLLEKQPGARYQSARDLQVDLTNFSRDSELDSGVRATVAGKRTVAVLPFKLLTPNPEDDYLRVALADAVINQLSSSADLLVRPTSTVMRYTQQAADPLAAARELNVQVIVDGSIQKFGQRLRVHVQAWNADGSTLFSGKHDSEMADLFELQDQVAASLSRALGTRKAEGEAPGPPPTRNPMAYQLFLRALEKLSRFNRWDTLTAIEMLENATKLDSRFADAWARLAEACILMGSTYEPGPRWLQRAELAIRKALAADPRSAEAQCARGRVLWTPVKKFQNSAALRALRDALRLQPGLQQALIWKGCVEFHVGLLEECKKSLTEALAANPDDAFTLVFIGQAAIYQGNYEEAEEYIGRTLALDPANLWANLLGPVAWLYHGKLDEGAERIRTSLQLLPGDSNLLSCEALLWAKRGEKRKAGQALEKALKTKQSLLHTHHMIHNVAAACATIGKPARAVELLRKAAKTGFPTIRRSAMTRTSSRSEAILPSCA